MISILYVDDEPGLLDIGKLFLERSGQFSVDIITSARTALDLLNSKTYDAIISDYQMPEMDGIELLKKVRNSGNTIPFILFTGRGREEVVIQALNEGADFFLQKGGEPLPQFTELAHQIRQAVQQRRAEASIRDHERREADIINFLPDATFAINNERTVIAWNRAMEEMTGVKAAEMLEKGNYEYAIPGYHERQPVLIDLVLHEDPVVLAKYPLIQRNGPTLITETTSPFLYNGKGATLRLIATPLYNNQGKITGAIESLRDITESRKAETELRVAFEQISAAEEELRSQYNELSRSERLIRENEDNFHSMVETAPDAMYISVGEKFAYVNPAMVRLIGATSADQLVGMSLYDRIHPSFHKGIHERLRIVVDEHKPAGPKETVYLKMDGTPINIESSVASFRYHNTWAGLVILHDITLRKNAEQQLCKSEEKYRELVENANSIILKWDKTGNVTFLNEYGQHFFGYTWDEIIGKPVMGTIVPATGSDTDLSLMIDDIIRHPEDHVINENENITREGKRIWIRWQNKPLFDENGQFAGLFSIGTDITDRKYAEEALRESEIRFRAQYESNPLAIFTWQHRDGDFIFIGCNKAAERLTKGRSHDYLGRTASDLYATRPEIISGIRKCFFDRAVRSGDLVSEHFLPKKHIHTTAAFIPPDLIMVHMEDITGRQAADKSLREANKKLNLLYGITRHDINNQILALSGFIELLHEKIPDPALEYYFSWITQSVNRISAMIGFAQVYETIGVAAPAWQDAHTLVDAAIKQAPLGKVMVRNDLGAGTELFADPLIVRVFYNLMDNAVRYGGKITVIRFFWEDRDGNGVLVCEDDGTGIPHADKEHIFGQGFGKNTGFGLFLAREVLSITGITIRETGEPGKGARFEMIVPSEAYRHSHAD